jgi:Fe-S-cluster containining protein
MEHGVCLSIHRDYVCKHAGACCTAGWEIPVEAPIYQALRVHFRAGDALFDAEAPRPDGAAAMLGRRGDSGACVFFEPDRGRLCAVHRELGADRLPMACRQFPRVVLRDGRGIHISLSHYCPTAAELLLADTPIAIVSAPAALALDGAAEGLDARDALPPLLHPGMLMDLDAYDRWERRAIAMLSRHDLDAAHAIEGIAGATRRIQSWRPGGPALGDVVEREFDVARAAEANEDLSADAARAAAAIASVPPRLTTSLSASIDGYQFRWQDVARWWPDVDRVVRRYLAARLFGNWVAYHGTGLQGIVEYLRVCLSVVRIEAARLQAAPPSSSSPWQIVTEAIRNADLLLVHLSDPTDLSRRLS